MSTLAVAAFTAAIFPALSLAERRLKGYSELLVQRRPGEIKRSLVAAFGMFAALISICWGWFGERWLALACVFAWGFGDAAALVGKKFGRHHLKGRLIEGRKSVEGALAMFVVSFFSVLGVLLVNGKVVWYIGVPIAALTAAVCAVVELYTRKGMDTLTCPLAAAAVILPLVRFWGA